MQFMAVMTVCGENDRPAIPSPAMNQLFLLSYHEARENGPNAAPTLVRFRLPIPVDSAAPGR